MDIRFISSLTADDENVFAPALLRAIGALLDMLPIAYTIRIETTGTQIFQHTHAASPEADGPSQPSLTDTLRWPAHIESRTASAHQTGNGRR